MGLGKFKDVSNNPSCAFMQLSRNHAIQQELTEETERLHWTKAMISPAKQSHRVGDPFVSLKFRKRNFPLCFLCLLLLLNELFRLRTHQFSAAGKPQGGSVTPYAPEPPRVVRALPGFIHAFSLSNGRVSLTEQISIGRAIASKSGRSAVRCRAGNAGGQA